MENANNELNSLFDDRVFKLDASPEGIASRLRAFRLEIKLTQNTIAVVLGVNPSYISKIENAKKPISDTMLNRLTRAYSLDPDWLANGMLADSHPDYLFSEAESILFDSMFTFAETRIKLIFSSAMINPTKYRLILDFVNDTEVCTLEKIIFVCAGLNFKKANIPFNKWIGSLEHEPLWYIKTLLNKYKNYSKDLARAINEIETVYNDFKATGDSIERNNKICGQANSFISSIKDLKQRVDNNFYAVEEFSDDYEHKESKCIDSWYKKLTVNQKHMARYLFEEYVESSNNK